MEPAGQAAPARGGPHKEATIIPHEGQVKEGLIDGYTVMCDEAVRPGTAHGGTGTAPSPLAYFALGIGF